MQMVCLECLTKEVDALFVVGRWWYSSMAHPLLPLNVFERMLFTLYVLLDVCTYRESTSINRPYCLTGTICATLSCSKFCQMLFEHPSEVVYCLWFQWRFLLDKGSTACWLTFDETTLEFTLVANQCALTSKLFVHFWYGPCNCDYPTVVRVVGWSPFCFVYKCHCAHFYCDCKI